MLLSGEGVRYLLRALGFRKMNRHLQDGSEAVPAGRHALMVLDGAGWHRAKALNLPANVLLLIQPAYSPELNPLEQVFSFPKSNYFANRVFATVTEIKDAVHDVWIDFAQTPNRITSIGTREWARLANLPTNPTEATTMAAYARLLTWIGITAPTQAQLYAGERQHPTYGGCGR